MSLTGHNLAIGGNCAWFSCPEVGPNGPCTGKAKVAYETVEHNDGKKEFLYHYESRATRNTPSTTFLTWPWQSPRRPGLR